MDGMFYRREGDEQHVARETPESSVRLLLVAIVIAAAAVGLMTLMGRLGLSVAVPSEFPISYGD